MLELKLETGVYLGTTEELLRFALERRFILPSPTYAASRASKTWDRRFQSPYGVITTIVCGQELVESRILYVLGKANEPLRVKLGVFSPELFCVAVGTQPGGEPSIRFTPVNASLHGVKQPESKLRSGRILYDGRLVEGGSYRFYYPNTPFNLKMLQGGAVADSIYDSVMLLAQPHSLKMYQAWNAFYERAESLLPTETREAILDGLHDSGVRSAQAAG